ncbi:MAG: transposase [Methylocella sp.]
MNILSREKQIETVAALTEGVSVHATERLTGVNRGTILSLGVRVGQGCAVLHDRLMRDLNVSRIELDEAWSFVAKKQARLTPEDGTDKGDQYVFLAIAGAAKAILSYCVGKRNQEHTSAFVADLRARVLGAPEISSDGWNCYPGAIDDAFGIDVNYGQIEKHYGVQVGVVEAARRYSPAQVVAVSKRRVVGHPRHISTSYIERQNLTIRMQQRRFTRLTNAFSKKLENHEAAVALYVSHYNFCRVHETLRVTPAMQLGVTDHIWSIGELVDAAMNNEVPESAGRKAAPFRVIDGGKL